MVSASSSFGYNGQTKTLSTYFSGGTNYGNFVNVSNGYLGFTFADPTVAGQTDFGYVTLSNSFGDSPSATLTIDSFTYDNTGDRGHHPRLCGARARVAHDAGDGRLGRRRLPGSPTEEDLLIATCVEGGSS